MKNIVARQIADLLNSENHLVVPYTEQKILSAQGNYVYETDDNDIVLAFIECKKVQWYQFEVCHLTVNPDHRGKQLGEKVINKAIEQAIADGARIMQCTIREDNKASQRLFTKCGFSLSNTFFYPRSGNHVGAWQKVVSIAT